MGGGRDPRPGHLHSPSVARRLGNCASGIFVWAVVLAPLAAQSGAGTSPEPGTAPRLSAVRVPVGPDASAWRDPAAGAGALPASAFIQAELLEGSPSTEHTEVRVVYDDEAIYVGAWLYDSNAEAISAGEQGHDAALTRLDAFLMIFDSFHDRENGFVTNPSGIQHDGQVVDEGRADGRGARRFHGEAQGGFNVNWDANWTVSTERDEAGWHALPRIPGRGRSFDTTLASVRVGYAFSPNFYIQSLVQYNKQIEAWSGNFRVGWIDSAGTGLFVVYNERQSDRLAGLYNGLLERTVSIKLSRQLDVHRLGNGSAG